MATGSLFIGGAQLPALPPVIDAEVSSAPPSQQSPPPTCRRALVSNKHQHSQRPLPSLPVAHNTTKQAVQQLLSQLSSGTEQQRIVAAHTLANLLETEEAKYRALVGDPHANPNLRSHYTIGKVLSVLKVRLRQRGRGVKGSCVRVSTQTHLLFVRTEGGKSVWVLVVCLGDASSCRLAVACADKGKAHELRC